MSGNKAFVILGRIRRNIKPPNFEKLINKDILIQKEGMQDAQNQRNDNHADERRLPQTQSEYTG